MNLLRLTAIAGLLLLSSCAGKRGPELVNWVAAEEATTVARTQGKPILYDFSAEWCGPCRRMSSEVFADAEMVAYLESRFVPVKVVDRRREEGRNSSVVANLQRRYSIDAFPTVIIVGTDGRVLTRMVGYGGRSSFRAILEEASAKAGRQV